eukprot:6663113-Alexandrium_andersonii.AAC.1
MQPYFTQASSSALTADVTAAQCCLVSSGARRASSRCTTTWDCLPGAALYTRAARGSPTSGETGRSAGWPSDSALA